jgi:hypothetical protein
MIFIVFGCIYDLETGILSGSKSNNMNRPEVITLAKAFELDLSFDTLKSSL